MPSHDSSGDSAAPTPLGPYRIERRLGAGGMGEVYLGFDQRLDRRVALKRLRPDRPGDRERLHREARALARLHHSSIVQCFDLLVLEDEEWLVLEYVEGPRLTDLLNQGPLPLIQVVEYGRQVAEGLQVAHLNGILHRDLKSENVVVDRATDRAKILDFGLVRRFDDTDESASLTASGALVGTPRAVAPEQALGLDLGPQTDLFSLGVLLHEMLTGRSPFRADSPTATLGRVLSQPPEPLPPGVPADLAALVTRLLEKSPEHRPRDAAEVAHRLGQIATTLPDAGRPHPPARARAPGDAADETTLARSTPRAGPPATTTNALGTTTPGTATSSTATPGTVPRRRIPWIPVGAAVAGFLAILLALAFRPDPEPPPSTVGALATDDAAGLGSIPMGAIPMGAIPMGSIPMGSIPSAASGWEALAAFDHGQVDRAIEIFQARLEADSGAGSADDHSGLARAYWRRFYETSGDAMWLEQSEAVARQAIALVGDPGEELRARTSLGLVLIEQGDLDAARVEIERALHLDPDDADANRGLAEVQQAGGEPRAAEASFRRAIARRPDDRELHDLLGSHLFRQGDLDSAEAAFRRSIELAPDAIPGYRNLAAVLITRGDLDDAVVVLERALEIRPAATLYLNLGTVFFFQGLYSRAADAYEQALETSYGVHQPVAWANLGDAYRQIPQRRHEAPAAFRQAVRLLETRIAEDGSQDLSRLSQLAVYQAKAELTPQARQSLDTLQVPRPNTTRPNVRFLVTDPRSLFRVATAWEILGERDQALVALAAAFEAGFDPREVQRDPEMVALRSDRRFHELLGSRDRP